jgi:hypothetical protein
VTEVCISVTQTVNIDREPAARPCGPIDLHQAEALIRSVQKAAGRKRCDHCGWSRHGADRGQLRRRLCVTCEIVWLDGIIRRLVKRVGRKAAIETLRGLAPKSK